ncbi:hypothetical protein [Methylobacterium sp. Leaf87]|uniref:hypothetical protein n=1 Tax=Methylobacterium sp. Leaf87 TaxID=1736243 RepID=UPI001FCDE0AB|nr:hypothetical protein [Methylobacterium sp. Leaf87]
MRRDWLEKLPVFRSILDLEADRKLNGTTLGLLKIDQNLRLDITKADHPEWTEEEQSKLLILQNKLDLFDPTDRSQIKTLRKIPYNFYYCYDLDRTIKHKIVDWEIGALYWNTRFSHGPRRETPFREKIEQYLPKQDLFLLMGNIHRFPDQWLAISLIYPPKIEPSIQGSFFD